MTEPPPSEFSVSPDAVAPYLETLGEGARLASARPLSGGASRDIHLLEIAAPADGAGPIRVVLRRELHKASATAIGVDAEFDLMTRARAAGVRVPRPIHCGADAEGRGWMIMEFVEGESLAPRLHRREEFAEARRVLPAQMAADLARIHSVPVAKTAIATQSTNDPARTALADYEDLFRRITPQPLPVFELAFRDLASSLPPPAGPCVLHGDFRLGNVMFGPEGLRAVLDWELAHVGDPAEDLAWTAVRAWRFGRDDLPVAGLGTREAFTAAYREAGGVAVTPERWRWWEIFGNLRWGVITLIQASHFLTGATRDLEKAAIGRRTSEVEAELLNLLED